MNTHYGRIVGLVLGACALFAAGARADILDYPDAAVFKGYSETTPNTTYGSCTKDTTTFATPTDGGPVVTQKCIGSSTSTLNQAYIADFLWPPTANTSTGVCTCNLRAFNNENGTTTTTWALAVACTVGGTANSTNKTFGTERSITLTNVAATVNTAEINQTNGTGAAPGSYTNLAAGTPCQFRVVRKHDVSAADATVQHVRAMHCSCL